MTIYDKEFKLHEKKISFNKEAKIKKKLFIARLRNTNRY